MTRSPIHPGEHLVEELKELGMSAAELARQIDVPVNRMTAILNGERGITADTALRLGHWFGTTAEFWLNLQTLYELRLARQEVGERVKKLPTLTGSRYRGESAPGRLLHDLMQVGPRKPIGYLPLYTVKELLRRDPEDIASEALALGLTATQFGPDRCCIKTGALYVYHREALAELLRAKANVLAANGLPTDPNHFVALIASVWFEPDHPIYPIIVAAFGGAPDH